MAQPYSERETDAPTSGDYVLKGGWYTLWVMLAVTLFAFVDRQLITITAAPMAASLGLNDSQIGLIQGLAFAIFSVVAVYPLAWAADRFDRRIVMSGCIVVWTIGTVGCGFARNFEQMFACAVAIAAGEAGLVPISQAFVPQLFKGRKRLLANGLAYFFAYLGIAAGLALGGSAVGLLDRVHGQLPHWLQAFESWRLAFFLVATPAPVLLLLLAFSRLSVRPEVTATTALETKDAAAPAAKGDMLPFLRLHWRALASVFGGIYLFVLGFGGYLAWLPIATTRLFGTTPAQNGTAMGIATAAGTIGGVAFGTFVVRHMFTRVGVIATLRFAYIVNAALIIPALILPFVGSASQAYIVFGILMCGGTAIGCMTPTLLQDMAPPVLLVRVLAIYGAAYGIIGGIAPTLVGLISTALGTQPHMLLVAITALAIPCWITSVLMLRFSEKPFFALQAYNKAIENDA